MRFRAILASGLLIATLGAACDETKAPDPPYQRAACDPLGGDRCYLPFPNDYFTVPDASTATGRRVDFAADTLPANVNGVHIDPTEWNRSDGFSPGSAIAVVLPGVDLEASGTAPITDIESSLAEDAPIVIIDARTGKRHPYWAELDAGAPDDDHRLLFVRPAMNFREGRRYIVALRGLVNHEGQPIESSGLFEAYRDGEDTGDDALESRRPHMNRLFKKLEKEGVARDELQLAWDFTVASGQNLSERLLAMRDDAFAQLGEAAPSFTIDSVEPSDRDHLAREVQGTFEVPSYLTGDGASGEVLNNGNGSDSPIPQDNGTFTARFICTVPSSALNPDGTANPTRGSLYGHGLLGSAREVLGAGSRFASTSNTTYCGTWWVGMSEEDIGSAIESLQDLSKFRTMPDRLQQAHLNFLFLGRLMLHADGFSSDPAFQAADGAPLLDQENLSFAGVSQGGILGGATTAVAQDWNRAFLGVPATNYSTLLDRSVDFDPFALIADPAYPDRVDRQVGILLAQMLWDRGENNGYAEHLTRRPYPGTPEDKQVMLFEAFGDHQVANVATEVMARTIDAKLRTPGLADGRSPDVTPFWGIRTADRFPHHGRSYLVVWDFGTPAPPTENVPNRAGEDPHGMGRDQLEVLTMAQAFIEQGKLIDTCDAGPCQTP